MVPLLLLLGVGESVAGWLLGEGLQSPSPLLWPLSPGADGQGQMGGGESGVGVRWEKVLSVARHTWLSVP